MDTVQTPIVLPTGRRPVGRPRDPRLDAAVLDATRALLVEVGYNQLSIEGIARRAGVHRPPIYRRWRSKAEIVHEAVYPSTDTSLRIVDTGNLLADLRVIVRHAIQLFSRAEVLAAFPGLMAEYRRHPEMRERLSPRMETSSRETFARLIDAAVRRGEAQAGVPTDTLFDTLAGTILFAIASRGVQALATLEDDVTRVLLRVLGADAERARPVQRLRVRRMRG